MLRDWKWNYERPEPWRRANNAESLVSRFLPEKDSEAILDRHCLTFASKEP